MARNKKWQYFQELTVETYLEQAKANNKKKIAELQHRLKKLEKSEKKS